MSFYVLFTTHSESFAQHYVKIFPNIIEITIYLGNINVSSSKIQKLIEIDEETKNVKKLQYITPQSGLKMSRRQMNKIWDTDETEDEFLYIVRTHNGDISDINEERD